MKNIEIPLQKEKTKTYIFFEKLPAVMSYSLLALPIVLSFISPRATAFFIIAYLLLWFIRAIALNVRVLQGYSTMKKHEKVKWSELLEDVENQTISISKPPKWHNKNIERLKTLPAMVKPSEAIHVAMIATYNESREVVEPTIQAVLDSDFDMKKVILILAYEERGGERVAQQSKELVEQYRDQFLFAEAIEHPDGLPNEVVGKGGNITYAARKLQVMLEERKIDPIRVQVTTLDADNRPHPQYFGALTYMFCLVQDPRYVSFQPIPIFTNNIWDVPALMRVVATGNSFWNIVQSLRPHMIRNFSSHAQGMAALIDTDFWSLRTIVEDGHQFWRTYFRYDGKHEVYPIYVPIYQDAVLAEGYRRTLRAQFIQIRRWAYGASDIAYVATRLLDKESKVPFFDGIAKLARLMESHLSWATAPIILAFSAFVPILFNPQDIAANQLPNIASRIQTVAMAGLIVTMYLSFRSLPPKPERYRSHRTLLMVFQWVLLPLTTIGYSAGAALNSQTRLLLGKYLDKFDVTEKAVVTDSGETKA